MRGLFLCISSAFPGQVWDVNFHKKGDFLGEARLTKQVLAEEVPVDGMHEFTVALGPKPGATDKFNRLAQGSLRLTCQVRPQNNDANVSVKTKVTISVRLKSYGLPLDVECPQT